MTVVGHSVRSCRRCNKSLSARLDRRGPAREAAQIGAVIGRDFSYSLLQRAVAGMDDAPYRRRRNGLPRS